jgi:hypothetical protein
MVGRNPPGKRFWLFKAFDILDLDAPEAPLIPCLTIITSITSSKDKKPGTLVVFRESHCSTEYFILTTNIAFSPQAENSVFYAEMVWSIQVGFLAFPCSAAFPAFASDNICKTPDSTMEIRLDLQRWARP